VLTVTLIPAYATFIPKSSLERFGASHGEEAEHGTLLTRFLYALGRFTVTRHKPILAGAAVVIAVSAIGISLIRVNDNPTKWFVRKHPIRVADRILNSHFGGTYMAYLVLEPKEPPPPDAGGLAEELNRFISSYAGAVDSKRREEIAADLDAAIRADARGAKSRAELVDAVNDWVLDRADEAGEGEYPLWDALAEELSRERARADIFKRPEMLRYVERLEKAIGESGLVGKTTSAATIVKYVHRELKSGEPADSTIPRTAPMVAECYIQAQSGHDPEDLWHLVTPGYDKANIWVQLKSGDNLDMERVTRAVDRFFAANPPPVPLTHRWAGLTYVNVVWQDKMVSGMVRSLLGSFAIVLLMMVFLFRSFLWGLLCMVPLSVTIAFIYGLIGFAGKDYDMPVAILSSLTLGLSVDFSIHYLQRAKEIHAKVMNWRETAARMSGEPARAITRNAVVIAVGFLPLLAAPLVPYKTVGFFLATIMAVSGIGTLVILPALITALRGRLFAPRRAPLVCNCVLCALTGAAAVCAVAFALHHYAFLGWTGTSIVAAALVVGAMLTCNRLSRLESCRSEAGGDEGTGEEETGQCG
jgi:uncharacterized protein